jgi:hypothetical protein
LEVPMSKVTPPNAAILERETVNLNDVVPELPSAEVTLPMLRIGSGLHRLIGVAEVLGTGGPTAKSVMLVSVSVQPAFARTSAVVLSVIPAAAVPSKQLALVLKPTKSTMVEPGDGQAVLSAVVRFTRAIFPPLTEILVDDPTTSGVGRAGAPRTSPA